jgi:hypothetical protein
VFNTQAWLLDGLKPPPDNGQPAALTCRPDFETDLSEQVDDVLFASAPLCYQTAACVSILARPRLECIILPAVQANIITNFDHS